jgi:hypothetical protein
MLTSSYEEPISWSPSLLPKNVESTHWAIRRSIPDPASCGCKFIVPIVLDICRRPGREFRGEARMKTVEVIDTLLVFTFVGDQYCGDIALHRELNCWFYQY